MARTWHIPCKGPGSFPGEGTKLCGMTKKKKES